MSESITVTGVPQVLRKLQLKADRIAASGPAATRAAATVIARAAGADALARHHKSGKLAASFRVVQAGDDAIIRSTDPVIRLIVHGTKAHAEAPRAKPRRTSRANPFPGAAAKALHFGTTFASSVMHPADAGDPFLSRVAQEVRPEAIAAARKVILDA